MLVASGADDDQRDASDQGDPAEDRRDGDGAGLLVFDLERADFGVLFFVGEAEASDGEADDAEDDQEDADDSGGSHGEGLLLNDLDSAGEMQISTDERYMPLT
jgi:hypothetical protein